jgi:hypothetical protein
VEVYCQCDHELAARRYNQRARTCHPIHVVTRLTPDMLAGYDRPVCIGELVTVNTALPVDAAAVAAAVRAHLPPPGVARAGRWPVAGKECLATSGDRKLAVDTHRSFTALRLLSQGVIRILIGKILDEPLVPTHDCRSAAESPKGRECVTASDEQGGR